MSETRQPNSPNERRRLKQVFDHATKAAVGGNYDYAIDLLTRCVVGDPGNLIYAQNYIANLQKKYNNNKKGSKLAMISGAGKKAAIKKAELQKDWNGVIAAGLEMLKLNPWDKPTLMSMAVACEQLQLDEPQLAYLKAGLDGNGKDVDLNRAAAKALAGQGRFDDAIRCWTRVVEANPNDMEAKRAIADLTVEKTIYKGGYEDAETSREVRADGGGEADAAPTAQTMTPERQLERAIAKNPEELSNYFQLADLHVKQERWEEAEKILNQAFEASGGSPLVRERLEDITLVRLREQLIIAERRAVKEGTQEAKDLLQRVKGETVRAEKDIYELRVERHREHTGYKIELALRLKLLGKYDKSIPLLQAAQVDPRRRGQVLLELGECFHQIKQYPLAMQNYRAAVEAITDREVELRKKALYRAGVLAVGLKNLDLADQYLSQLAGLDFAYKDVAKWLDKVVELRKKKDSGEGDETTPT